MSPTSSSHATPRPNLTAQDSKSSGRFLISKDRHYGDMSTAIELPIPVTMAVAGVSYRQGIVRGLSEHMHVILRRDHDNEFDENAIAFYTLDGEHFGYAPRAVASRMRSEDPDCERWGGQIIEVLRGKTWGLRVRVTHSNVRDYPAKPKQSSYIQPVALEEMADVDLPEGLDTPLVFSKSGRLLGRAVDYDATATSVKVSPLDGEGDVRLFPAVAVVVKESDAVH